MYVYFHSLYIWSYQCVKFKENSCVGTNESTPLSVSELFILVNLSFSELYIIEALPGVLGNRGKGHLLQGNRGTKIKF